MYHEQVKIFYLDTHSKEMLIDLFYFVLFCILVHFGQPTFEQKKMYTNVLRAIIRLSTLVFPESVSTGEVDVLARSTVWDLLKDNPKITGHGVGSYLSVQECKIYKFIYFFIIINICLLSYKHIGNKLLH